MSTVATTTAPGLPVEAFDKEALVKRNPHGDFATVQASRPDYNSNDHWIMTKTPDPAWQVGDGATSTHWKDQSYLHIDPHEEGRPDVLNYKLMISTTVPRPVAMVSTVTKDGNTRNLAPFSYFQAVTHDPPIYSLVFAGEDRNDSLQNVLDTGELCISTTSDWMIEACNLTSINTPPHISEWVLSGLTPVKSEIVQAPYIAESPVSIECKVLQTIDTFSKISGRRNATMVLVEAVRFHVWKDVLGPDKATADIGKLRPVFRAGGITYGTCFRGFEVLRPPAFRTIVDTERVKQALAKDGNDVD